MSLRIGINIGRHGKNDLNFNLLVYMLKTILLAVM